MNKKRKRKITEAKKGHLVIDFTICPELHDYLAERARKNFRQPEMEILAILKELKEQTL